MKKVLKADHQEWAYVENLVVNISQLVQVCTNKNIWKKNLLFQTKKYLFILFIAHNYCKK